MYPSLSCWGDHQNVCFLKTGFKQTISSPDVSLSRGLEEEQNIVGLTPNTSFICTKTKGNGQK